MEWLNRMKNALDLIEERMEERLDLDEIAKAAYSSPFHFQRMFHMLTGMTVADYVRKRKLTLAAQELAASSAKVLDVALKYGYDSPEAFAKAFRRIHGISPSEARNPGVGLKAFPRLIFHLSLKGDQEMNYRIEEKEAFAIVGKALRTTCENGEQMRRIPLFWEECHRDGTTDRLASVTTDGLLLGAVLDMQAGQDEMTYMVAARSDLPEPGEGYSRRTIPALTWAIFPSSGPLPGSIQGVFQRIYQEWFPSSGYEHAGGPEIEAYPRGDTTAEDYRCEVWVPIVKK
ncbi:AraC family transcriptional regulator [Cohnella zeiphila]|uniref:GyrI-like domain-containing protein n=1 Tax=Cohnella zeiphila TaxID=2761120 RepID=A0A7X0SQR2_9BACL|nr:GyrI-like domain-containing protein [Cohnella zeiphila]MBB6733200.1 GyrI-like domain-containing protein [Cohnella zeiphila]